MSLQTKFGLAILAVFTILAVSIAIVSFVWVDQNTIRDAQQRVQLYIQGSWEIYNAKLERMESALDILARNDQIRALLKNPSDTALALNVRASLESIRQSQNMDVLNLMDAQGKVVLRTRPPYNNGDSVTDDPVVQRAIASRKNSSGTVILAQDRLMRGGEGLLERCLEFGGEPSGMMLTVAVPIIVDNQLIGILQIGNLLNGSVDKVDRIRDTVFKNETYAGKPLGTATIFMSDLRISTNVLDSQGNRAIGTRASPEVTQQVLVRGQPWTGRAWVVDRWYLAQYDPIRDPNGNVIGMLYVGELEQKYLDLRTQALTLFLLVILAGMVVALAVFFALARHIVAPIHQLSYATKRIAEGDFAYRVNGAVSTTTQDEVKKLAIAFDDMAKQLQRQREQIQRDHQALEQLNQELQTTNRNYMEMLGFVAHELKNPLSSAILNVGTVKDGFVGPVNEKQKEALESAARSLHYFKEMIANYLDLSRLEKGELVVVATPTNLHAEVIQPALDSFARAIAEKKMILEDRTAKTITLQADRNLLRIVYDNLLSNAIKYGRDGGRIVLDAQARDGQIVLSVCNESEGIPPDKVPLLFKKFSRLTGPETVRKKGTGLGLYICKEIVEKHGGTIWVESQPGKWTSFLFTLPSRN